MSYSDIVKFLVAMVIMMNPLGSLSIFLGLTRTYTRKHQRQTAFECSIGMVIIMLISIWLGHELLDVLGITIDSFRFAGGLILLLIGLSMLQSQESPVTHTHADDVAAEKRASIAIVPMALPIIIGPGAISTLVLASTDYTSFFHKLILSFLCFVLALGMGCILYFSKTIAKLVGESIINLITRIMGMLIMAIAVGMLANGLIGLIPALR